MIPDAAEVLELYEVTRARWGTKPASERAVHAALAAARKLTRNELQEPGVLLFVFASYRRAFPGAWNFMARAIAAEQAHALGYTIESTQAEMDALLAAVMYGTAGYEDVQRWVTERLRPLHQS